MGLTAPSGLDVGPLSVIRSAAAWTPSINNHLPTKAVLITIIIITQKPYLIPYSSAYPPSLYTDYHCPQRKVSPQP